MGRDKRLVGFLYLTFFFLMRERELKYSEGKMLLLSLVGFLYGTILVVKYRLPNLISVKGKERLQGDQKILFSNARERVKI